MGGCTGKRLGAVRRENDIQAMGSFRVCMGSRLSQVYTGRMLPYEVLSSFPASKTMMSELWANAGKRVVSP